MAVEELVVLDLVTGYGGCEELRLLLHALLKFSPLFLQGSAKRRSTGCVIAAGKARQKW